MNKIKSTCKLALTVFALTIWGYDAHAQVNAYCSNCGGSDYYFTVYYDFTTGYRDQNAGCGLTSRQLEGGSNSPGGCPNNVWTGIETVGAGNIQTANINVGPGYSNNVYFSDYYAWRTDDIACGAPASIYTSHSECRPYSYTQNVSTAAIFAPATVGYTLVNVTNIPGLQFANINWTKGSDIPDANLFYRVYRLGVGGALLATLPATGSSMSYTDSTLLGDGNFQYAVTTYTTSWGNQESVQNQVTVPISNSILTASQGTYYGRTQLSWPNIADFAPNGISVESNGVQLTVANSNSTGYSDGSGVPGVKYNYTVSPILGNNTSPWSFQDSGYSRPNGILKGNVTTVFNAAVSGVTMYAFANVNGNLIYDSTLTDASGYYQFVDLFYDTSAVWTIVPHKGSHKFNPDTLTRILSINSNQATGVNFQDTSVFTIRGRITFAPNPNCGNDTCSSAGVTIYSNSLPTAGVTGSNGIYSFAIQTQGRYTMIPTYGNHRFSPDSIVIDVAADSFGVNFTDLTTDTLFISLRGGCGNRVTDYAQMSVSSTTTPDYTISLDTVSGYNQQYIVAPAQAYDVHFIYAYSPPGHVDPNIIFASPDIAVDLTNRDSATVTRVDTVITVSPPIYDTLINHTIDTIPGRANMLIDTVSVKVETEHRADFIYHGRLSVTVPNFPLSSVCQLVDSGYIMTQGNNAGITVLISETYIDSTTCPVDSGQLIIYDDVSDISGPQTVNFYNGQYNYNIMPGTPIIAAPYTKLLQVFAYSGASSNSWSKEIVVTGDRPQTQTFVTETPQLPFFILHAPPGNNSYSFLAQDSSVSYSYSNAYQYGGSAGPYIDAKIGAGVPIPFTGITVGAGVEITADAQAGQNVNNESQVNTTFTAHTQVSTASATNNTNTYSGHQGDVYVGGSFNMIYALCDVIRLNDTTCTLVHDTALAWGANGLATNYMYTELFITGTLIPQLQELQSLASPDSAELIQTWIDVWNQVVQKNHHNCDTASTFRQNISYSSGAIYDNEMTTSYDSSTSINYQTFLNANVGVGVIFGENLNEFANTQLGVKANFQWNMNKTTNSATTKTKTYAYHLEDDAGGNSYSVNICTDNGFGTPCFPGVLGASACPHWPGTQARDSVDIFLDNHIVSNVPINQTANFTAHILNLSESGETRTYSVEAVPESNLDGAIISIGGYQINNSPASFTVPGGTDLPVILTVAAGPVASDYNNLQVSAFSSCDGGEGNTITFSAQFQSTCSPIGLYSPSDNWLVNAANRDSLYIIFSGYNANDTNLININLEYSAPGGTWLPAMTRPIPRSALINPYYSVVWNVASIPDGTYQIRAYANCGSQPGGSTYSATLTGTIDRSGLSLFGTPSPADGVLNINDNISVTFNGNVDCNQAAIYSPIISSLVRNDNGQVIPDSVTCNGNMLIIYTNPPSLIDSLENVTLTATINNVYDTYGNSLQQPIVWSFLVSRSKVYWNPANMNVNAVTGATANATGVMYNTGPLDTFTIIHMPTWLSTPPTAQYIISAGTPLSPAQISIPFTVSNSLNPGSYTDTVIALANGEKIFLFVSLDVVSPAPNWSVNPANFQYSMNITANYSTTQLNAPLSSDTRDIIAAFVGNQCRGVGHIAYDPGTNSYSAFITAYSNSVVGDTFTFRMWDALPGIEYQAVQRLPFITDGSIGQPLAPYILHPAGVFQTVTFVPGWNWFSLNVAAADMSPKNVLGSITGNNGAVVKTIDVYDQFTSTGTGWEGALSAFTTNKSYMINLDHSDTLHFLGQLITDTSIISVASGWNWVGFPRQKIATASSFLSTVNASDSDLLKSQTLFTQFNSGSWSGDLDYMYPGQGYKLKTANAFNFVIPPDRSLPSWNVDENSFQQNQSVTADLQFDGVSTRQSNYIIGAFTPDNTCVGTAQPEYIAALGLYRVFLTIHGDVANAYQPLTFKVWDTNNDVGYTPNYAPLSVVPDTVVSRVEAPYVINVQTASGINALTYTDGYGLLQNVPNPFSKTTAIQYYTPSEQMVTLTLYDESGRMIRELVNGKQAAGNHQVSFEQDNLEPGVYLYQMKAGDFVKTRRMLILQ